MQSRVIPSSIPRLAQQLSDNGYYCEAIGKMHYSPQRNHHGFHKMQTMEETPVYAQDDDYIQFFGQMATTTYAINMV